MKTETESKPTDAEQESGKGLDGTACSPSFRIRFKSRDELLEQLCIKQFGAVPIFDEENSVI